MSYQDLTAITWSEALDRLLVIADAKDRILVVRADDGAVEAEVPIPGRQQEGLTLDAAGGLWIADDLDKSLLRLKDAAAKLLAMQQEGRREETAPGGDEESEGAEEPPKKGGLFTP